MSAPCFVCDSRELFEGETGDRVFALGAASVMRERTSEGFGFAVELCREHSVVFRAVLEDVSDKAPERVQ